MGSSTITGTLNLNREPQRDPNTASPPKFGVSSWGLSGCRVGTELKETTGGKFRAYRASIRLP